MNAQRVAEIILRIGVAFAFLFPPIDAMVNPYSWIGYFPAFLKGFVPDLVLLQTFGMIEIVIALWILSGWRIFVPSLIATGMLLAIVFFNRADFEVLFRDLSIAAMTLSLAVVSWDHEFRRVGPSRDT